MSKEVSNNKPARQTRSASNEIVLLKQQVSELTDALMRERADAINVRRRSDEDRLKMASYYKAEIVRELLPVFDSFDRAQKHVPLELQDSEYVKGIQNIIRQFENILQGMGVTRIKTVGEPFDPKVHEAVSMEEDSAGSQEIVSDELQAGYLLGDEVIRHAMVRVRLG
jgi:molecular chaperone GrpE